MTLFCCYNERRVQMWFGVFCLVGFFVVGCGFGGVFLLLF